MAQRAGNAAKRLWRVAYSRCFSRIFALFVISCMSGCGSGGTGGSAMPDLSPSAAAAQAIELLDKDDNGSLDETELAACPGILASRDRNDTDRDGQVSQDELESCLAKIYAGGTPWATVNCRIVQEGRPIAGADVRFVPEPFLGDALQPATGKTDNQGRVNPAVADEKLPEDKKGLRVMQLGVYRVEVTHPSVKQPHKPLGCVVDDNLVRSSTELTLQL
jgi:hypothetical protein